MRGFDVSGGMRRRWLTTEEVAQMLGISPHTLRGWRRRGYGPPYRQLSRIVRYERGEVEQWHATTKVLAR